MELIYKYVIPNRLYHASPASFRSFDLEKAYNFKDFGRGFYLTTNFEQALKWANGKRRHKEGYIYEYFLDKEKVENIKLNIMEFLDYSISWAHFLAAHRHEIIEDAGLDLIYDRMADSSSEEITNAIDGFYQNAENSEKLMMEVFAEKRMGNSKYDQYCFKTQRAIDLLRCERVAIVFGNREKPKVIWKGAVDFYEQKGL